jgi:phage protein D
MDLSSLTSLLTGGASVAPAVRRPTFHIEFAPETSGGDGADGLGGLVAAAASALGLGSAGSDPWKESVIAITVEAGLAPCANVAEIYLASGERAPVTTVGDKGSISLGYEDDESKLIFTGQVAAVRRSVGGLMRVTATDSSAALSHLRVNQSYDQQAAGSIVSDLAGRADAAVDTVEDGISFPFYVVDDRRSAYDHIATLARKCGFLAYITPEGKLTFAAFTAADPEQTLVYGQDILALQVTEGTPPYAKITMIGEGAAGSHGQDAWGWLIKDPAAVKSESGEGTPERTQSDPSLRTAEAVQTTAAAIAGVTAAQGLTGTLLAPGAPAVLVGRSIAITGAPEDALNGTYWVHGIRHRFSKTAGFTTLIFFTTATSGGSTGGLLGGLL